MQDPWSRFCASGKIASTTVAKDVAGSVAQQLKHVSNLCLWWLVFYIMTSNMTVFLCQATAFAEHIASGVMTAEFATKRRRLEGRIEHLRTQHTEAVRDKSAVENRSRNLLEKLSAVEAEKEDLGRRLAAE
jgi:hypothetical protein